VLRKILCTHLERGRIVLQTKGSLNFGTPRHFFVSVRGSLGLLNAIQSASAVSEEPTARPKKTHTLSVGAEEKLKNRNQFGPVCREEIESVILVRGQSDVSQFWHGSGAALSLAHTFYDSECAAELLTLCVDLGRWVPLRGAPVASIDKSFANLAPPQLLNRSLSYK
jgi:hypothetical protein